MVAFTATSLEATLSADVAVFDFAEISSTGVVEEKMRHQG
jgi:hypothetical protein